MPPAGQQGEGGFDGSGIGNAPCVTGLITFCLRCDGGGQFSEPPAAAGGGAHHRARQQPGKRLQIPLRAVLLRLVQQVYTHHQPRGDLPDLQHQVQIALQTGGVHHCQSNICRAGEEKVPGHLLFRGVGAERVGAGQVHQAHGIVPGAEAALRRGHCFSRPVPCVLVQPRQGVEDRGFAHIGVARQGHRDLFHTVSPLPQMFPHCMREDRGRCRLFAGCGAYTVCVLRGSREEEAR